MNATFYNARIGDLIRFDQGNLDYFWVTICEFVDETDRNSKHFVDDPEAISYWIGISFDSGTNGDSYIQEEDFSNMKAKFFPLEEMINM